MKSTSFFLFFVLLAFSCKNQEKKDSQEKPVPQTPFTVIINMTAKEDDIMTLYFKDNSMSNFEEEKSIYKEVKKGDQEIVIELPKGFLPNDFRFDISAKVPTQVCKVERIYLVSEQNSFEVLNQDLERYLIPNKGVVFDTKDRSYSFKEVEGDYDPALNVTPEFYAHLVLLVGNAAMKPPVD